MFNKIDLGELLELTRVKAEIDPLRTYKLVTIRMNNNGITEREQKLGSEIASSGYIARKGQFMCSKIDARNGALGILPEYLDSAVVTNDFLTFNINNDLVLTEYLEYYSRTYTFNRACLDASEGSTNRKRLKIDRFFKTQIPLPDLTTQNLLIEKIESIKSKSEKISELHTAQVKDYQNLLYSKYIDITKDCPTEKMGVVAPIVRRPVEVEMEESYPELGIRSFGKGTFHKPPVNGIDVGTKKLYYIKADDLMFSNVFAWEGAIAVAKEEDNDRVGSHRFISCVPDPNKVLPHFLCYHFLTPSGMEDIQLASPGGAGRNKTLGLTKLEKIEVPIPSLEAQLEFQMLLAKTKQMKVHIEKTKEDLDELFPALLDKAFKGELV